MIIFLYLILVLAWALLIIILKCKKARAKRLAEQEEMTQQVHVVQIGSNLYDIMSLHRDNYSGVYSCMEHGTIAQHRQRSSANVTHSNAAFVGDDGAIYPGNSLALEPPPSYEEVIRLPAYYPKVETFIPEMVVPPPATARPQTTAVHQPTLQRSTPSHVQTDRSQTSSVTPLTGTPEQLASNVRLAEPMDANGNRVKVILTTNDAPDTAPGHIAIS